MKTLKITIPDNPVERVFQKSTWIQLTPLQVQRLNKISKLGPSKLRAFPIGEIESTSRL